MRKNILTALLLLIAGVQIGWAQRVTVRMNNAQSYEFNLPDVECIIFDEDGPAIGRQYVDLELPSGTLWATCNVGANSPEEYGSYFAWGETKPKNVFNWGTYKLCGGSQQTMKKYCVDSMYGTIDNLVSLEAGDDAATTLWGSEWQMPSQEQLQELFNSYFTTWEQTTQNGVKGMKVTSRMNGKSIFLPAAGGFCTMDYTGANYTGEGSYGYYWTRSLCQNACYAAGYLIFYQGGQNVASHTYRYYGCSIRPVRANGQLVTSITLSLSALSLKPGEIKTLIATVLPENAGTKTVTWESSNTNVANVNGNGMVTAKAKGSCVITCRATDGSNVSALCQVTVTGSDTQDGDYVDLGLPSGTLWATHNVGANAPEEFGDYFAWGETTPKENYLLITYEYGNKASWFDDWKVFKYCTHANEGVVDNKTELEPIDDAATENWGSEWQTPSIEQIVELLDSRYTTVTDEIVNTIICRKVTSKANGKSIILPCSGWMVGTELDGAAQEGGCYWSRLLDPDSSLFARILYLDGNNNGDGYIARSTGCAVRPVRKN